MKYKHWLPTLLMVMSVGCLNENPMTTGSVDSPDSIPPAPKMAPFLAHQENTIVPVGGNECSGVFDFPGVIDGDHIGAGTISSTSTVNFCTFPFEQTGQATITAANGDELVFDYVGTAVPGTEEGDVIFGGDFTFLGGTGRFATASGGGTYAGSANTIAAVGQYDMDGMISR